MGTCSVTECQQTRRSSVDCWQHQCPPAEPPAVPAPRHRLLAGPARQHGLLAVPAGRRGQLAVTQSSGSLPACAARRGRMLAYYYKYTGTASMQTHSDNTASRMPESAWGWSILQDERRRGPARPPARARGMRMQHARRPANVHGSATGYAYDRAIAIELEVRLGCQIDEESPPTWDPSPIILI